MILPLPEPPHVRQKSFEIDDEDTFAGALLVTFNSTTNRWVAGIFSAHPDQLGAVATAYEKLAQQDFSQPTEASSFEVDAVLAPDGVTVEAPGFTVSMTQVGDLPSSFNFGGQVMTPGTARSLQYLIRHHLGIGTAWVP